MKITELQGYSAICWSVTGASCFASGWSRRQAIAAGCAGKRVMEKRGSLIRSLE
ncbi:hypothetical protein D9M70_587120 [compost metagenome]